MGRFINSDGQLNEGFLGNNMFAYCLNKPIMLIDIDGTCPYNGTVADFHRIEQGLPSLDCNCVDLTQKLNEFMEENAKNLKEFKENNKAIDTLLYFYENVTDGGALDIKLQDDWKFEEGRKYFYNGKELRCDDPGNINFGYVGAVILPETVLCAGAGLHQIKNYGFKYGNIFTFFDDPRDGKMIKYGYSLYKEKQE